MELIIGLGLAVVLAIALFFVFNKKSASPSSSTPAQQHNNASSEPKEESYPGGKLSIFFGSQTGTAEGFAQQIAEGAKKKGFDAQVIDLEDFEVSDFVSTKLALFLMATYGEGEPTDNALEFMKWLKNYDGEEGNLDEMNFSVFGLGNTQYEHYNMVGKTVDTRLIALGAKRFFDLGLGDDDASIEEDFDSWREKMMEAMVSQFNASAQGASDEDDVNEVPELPFTLVYLKNMSGGPLVKSRAMSDEVSSSAKHFWTSTPAKVVANRELRQPADGGSCVHVELDIADSGITYHTADNLAVMPLNDDASVEKLARVNGYELDAWFKLEGHSPGYKHHFPVPTTVRHALRAYCDLHGIVRRSLLKELIPFATDATERETLTRITSKTGRAEFKQLVDDRMRSFLDILLVDFVSLRVPLDHFFAMCPRMQPRYYTISSSSRAHPHTVHVTCAVVNEKKQDGGVHHGVCSTYLANLVPNSSNQEEGVGSCRVFVRDSSFRLPKDLSTPVILIGPGTGIAPMRAILQEREELMKSGAQLGECVLYFGCKRKDQDFIYQDELEGYAKSGVLNKFEVAFSRQTKTKVYVQNLMQQSGEYLWNLINNEGAYIYVCGGTAMGSDVGAVFHNIAKELGGKSDEQSKKFIADLKEAGRYVQELWA